MAPPILDLIRREDLVLSTISILEIVIKARIGKLNLSEDLLERALHDLEIEVLPYTEAHARELYTLPVVKGHGDPFDRALIATAMAEGIPAVSTDSAFPLYRVFGLKVIA